MNRFIPKYFVVVILTLAGMNQQIVGKVVQMSFPLPNYSQLDRDSFIVHRFLFYRAFSEIDEKQKEGYTFSLSSEGNLVIAGEEQGIGSFLEKLGRVLQHLILTSISEEKFTISKQMYIAYLDDILEKSLIEEIRQEDFLLVGRSIQKLAQILANESTSRMNNQSLAPNTSQSSLFDHIPITQMDQDNINQLITKLADYGYLRLLGKKKEMEKLGDKVYHVHPLRFIGYIYKQPNLRKKMIGIMNDPFKRRGFFNGRRKREGFSQRMTKEMKSNNLVDYLPGFVRFLGISEEEVIDFFYHHDWQGLLRYLNKALFI